MPPDLPLAHCLITCTPLSQNARFRTHKAPDSPACDDVGAEGEGRVRAIAFTDARGEHTRIAARVHEDVMNHRLVALHQQGLILNREGRVDDSQDFLSNSYSLYLSPAARGSAILHFSEFLLLICFSPQNCIRLFSQLPSL